MKTDPLASLGYRLGSRTPKPAGFVSSHAWNTPRYTFQLDTAQSLGRRIGSGANPVEYFSIIPLADRPGRRQSRLTHHARTAFATVAAVALLLVLYPLYPAADYQVRRTVATTISDSQALAAAPAQVSSANRIVIPKIGVDTAIVEGPTLDVLDSKNGVWHETGTELDNLVLAGHRFRYLPPNATTLYNLDKVTVGDTIVVDWYRKRYIYVITSTKVVSKREISVRNPTETPTLTIYSCEQKDEARRIVVTARRLD